MMYRSRVIAAVLAGIGIAATLTTATHAYSVSGYKWDSAPVPFYVNASNQDVSANAAITAIQQGMNAWNSQSGSWLRLSYAGQVSDTAATVDGRNVIIFRNQAKPDGSAALATTYNWSSGGVRFDSDIIFWDGKYQFFTGSAGCSGVNAYIEDIAAHELGHAVGLMHSSASDATMYSTYTACSTTMRTLASDDVAGLTKLYPASGAVNAAPTVSIATPAANTSVVQGTSVTFSGSAADTEDGNLSSQLQWKSSVDGSIGNGSSVSKALSAGSHTITATVLDSKGLSASRQIAVNVTAPAPTNTAPSVSIATPANNQSAAQGTSLTFSGSANDTQDGSLSAKLQWKSSLAGAIGTGSSFSKALSVGTHTITATVVDSGGLSASKQILVTITASAPAPAPAPTPSATRSLTVKAYKVKGEQQADLTWSGFSSTTVDVYRSGTKVTTTANDKWWTDAIGKKGGGSYTYKVCEAGTSTCSSSVTASF